MTKEKRSAAQRQAQIELESVLEDAARRGDKHESKASIARRVYNDNRALVNAVAKVWILERMGRILDRLEAHRPDADQLTIPGIDLPPVITLLKPDPGSRRLQKPLRIALLDCTRPQLLEYRKELLRSLKSNKRVQEVDKALALMQQHAPRSKRATLREVLEKHGQEKFDFTMKAER